MAFSIVTFLHIVLGELAPKTLVLARAQKVVLADLVAHGSFLQDFPSDSSCY
jgi:CBS domain containing-hemolysin-like protein